VAPVISLARIWLGSGWFVVTSGRSVGDAGGVAAVYALAIAIAAAVITVNAMDIVVFDMAPPWAPPFLADEQVSIALGSAVYLALFFPT